MIDMGTQESEFQGEKKKSRKIRLTFELPKKRQDFDGVSRPLSISKDVGFSMYSKATLRAWAEALLGRALQDKEADALDVETLLGRSVLATVLHEKMADGVIRARFKGVAPVMEGMDCPRPENKVVCYSLTQGPTDVFDKLPNWLKEKIVAAPEWNKDDETADEDIPF